MPPIVKFVVALCITALACTQQNPSRLMEYLTAEKKLRNRVTVEQGLPDSIQALQKKFNINVEREYSKLNDNPEAWIKLLKELRDEK